MASTRSRKPRPGSPGDGSIPSPSANPSWLENDEPIYSPEDSDMQQLGDWQTKLGIMISAAIIVGTIWVLLH